MTHPFVPQMLEPHNSLLSTNHLSISREKSAPELQIILTKRVYPIEKRNGDEPVRNDIEY